MSVDIEALAAALAAHLQVKETITFGALFETYMSLHARPHCRSWRNIERCYASYLSHWSDRQAGSLTRLEVQELHARLGMSAGPTTANRVLELLRPIYNHANQLGLYTGSNPAKGIKLFKLQSRERFFERDEIQRLFQAVDSLRYAVTQDFILMCLFTAARRSNVATMRWEDISLERAVWRIPLTKNGSSQYLPLTPSALAVLARRRQANDDSPWVFPSDRSQSGHLTKPEEAWRVVIARAGLNNARLHDLRRTLASWQALTGANIAVIGATLNHKDLKSTQVYARMNLEAVRAAMVQATDSMTS